MSTSSRTDHQRAAQPKPARSSWVFPLVLLLATGFLLGVSTNLAKLAGQAGLSPLSFLTWPVTGAAVVLFGVNAVRREWPPINRGTIVYFVIAGLVSVALANLISFAAVPQVGASFVSLVIAFPPLFTYLGALALGMERWQTRRALGVALSLGGVVLLAAYKFTEPNTSAFWIIATLCSPVVLAVGNIYRTARWPKGASAESLAPGTLATSSLWLLLAGLIGPLLTDSSSLFSLSIPFDTLRPALIILAQLAVFALQFMLLFKLQQVGGPVYLSLLGSVGAIVGVPVAVLVLGESWPQGVVVGGLLIGAGIALLSWGGANVSDASTGK